MEVVVCLERIQVQVFQLCVCFACMQRIFQRVLRTFQQRAKTLEQLQIALQDASILVLKSSTCALFVVEGVFVRRYFGNGETTKEERPRTGILGEAFLSMSLQVRSSLTTP